jgi:hypothetical protein
MRQPVCSTEQMNRALELALDVLVFACFQLRDAGKPRTAEIVKRDVSIIEQLVYGPPVKGELDVSCLKEST